jgi:Na+/pantothenate symporter
LLGSGWAAMGVGILFLLVGSVLWLGAQHGMFEGEKGVSPMLTYLQRHASPWLRGLMTAAILAAAMSSLGSSLAASTATLTNDLLPARLTDTLAKNRFALLGIAIAVWTLTTATAEFKARHPEIDLLKLALGSLTLVYGALLAFFVTALFSKARPSRERCIVAAVVGVATGISLFVASPLAFEWRVVVGLLVTGLVLTVGSRKAGPWLSEGERRDDATL